MLAESKILRIIGGRLAAARRARELSRDEVAAVLGRSSVTVARWEHGQRMPTVVMLLRLAALYDCSVLDLLPTWEQLRRSS